MSAKEKAKAKLEKRLKEAEFYAKVLSKAEKLDFEAAAGTNGLDDEITLLRVKIKKLVEDDPENIELMLLATATLAKLVKTQYTCDKQQGESLATKMKNVMKEIGVPLGVSLINKL